MSVSNYGKIFSLNKNTKERLKNILKWFKLKYFKLKLNFLEILDYYLCMIEILTWEFIILFHQTLNKFTYKIKWKIQDERI